MGKTKFNELMENYSNVKTNKVIDAYNKIFHVGEPTPDEWEEHNKYEDRKRKNITSNQLQQLYEFNFQQKLNGDYMTNESFAHTLALYSTVDKRLNDRNPIVKFLRSLFGFDKEEKEVLSSLEHRLNKRGIPAESIKNILASKDIDQAIENTALPQYKSINRVKDAYLSKKVDNKSLEKGLSEEYVTIQNLKKKPLDNDEWYKYIQSHFKTLPKGEDYTQSLDDVTQIIVSESDLGEIGPIVEGENEVSKENVKTKETGNTITTHASSLFDDDELDDGLDKSDYIRTDSGIIGDDEFFDSFTDKDTDDLVK